MRVQYAICKILIIADTADHFALSFLSCRICCCWVRFHLSAEFAVVNCQMIKSNRIKINIGRVARNTIKIRHLPATSLCPSRFGTECYFPSCSCYKTENTSALLISDFKGMFSKWLIIENLKFEKLMEELMDLESENFQLHRDYF